MGRGGRAVCASDCYGLALIKLTRARSRRSTIKLLAKLGIVKLKRRKKEREERKGLTRRVINKKCCQKVSENVRGGQARNKH